MRPSALAISLAMTLATASTHADPALPKGWIQGGPSTPMAADPAPSPRSREALQLASSPVRGPVAPVSIGLEGIEVVEVEPEPARSEIEDAKGDVPGDAPEDLFVDRGCTRASVRGHSVGSLSVGWVSEPIGPQSSGGPSLWHVRGDRGLGDGKHLYTRASWETIDRAEGGALRFTETVARFHVRSCKARTARRYSAIARPILGGFAYVFRARCARCAPDSRDALHVILPPGDWGTEDYSHRVVRLPEDGADHLRVSVSPARVQKLARAIGRPLPSTVDMDRVIGIEVAKGLWERAPTVIGYTHEARHQGF